MSQFKKYSFVMVCRVTLAIALLNYSQNCDIFYLSKLRHFTSFLKGLVNKKKLFRNVNFSGCIDFSQILTFLIQGYQMKQRELRFSKIPIVNFDFWSMSQFHVTVSSK